MDFPIFYRSTLEQERLPEPRSPAVPGHAAAIGSRGDPHWVLLDGATVHGPFADVAHLAFAPGGSLVFIAARSHGRLEVFWDGGHAGPFTDLQGGLVFAPDRHTPCFCGRTEDSCLLWIGTRCEGPFDGVDELRFAPDGSPSFAWHAWLRAGAREFGPFDEAGVHAYAPDGSVALAARSGRELRWEVLDLAVPAEPGA